MKCTDCQGTGLENENKLCPNCNGFGVIGEIEHVITEEEVKDNNLEGVVEAGEVIKIPRAKRVIKIRSKK